MGGSLLAVLLGRRAFEVPPRVGMHEALGDLVMPTFECLARFLSLGDLARHVVDTLWRAAVRGDRNSPPLTVLPPFAGRLASTMLLHRAGRVASIMLLRRC